MKKMNIPVGISNFEKIRNGGFYYIDKSGLIAELLDEKAEVTLITRKILPLQHFPDIRLGV